MPPVGGEEMYVGRKLDELSDMSISKLNVGAIYQATMARGIIVHALFMTKRKGKKNTILYLLYIFICFVLNYNLSTI